MKEWLVDVSAVITANLKALEAEGDPNKIAKWRWFAGRFRSGIERMEPQWFNAIGLSVDAIPKW
jgi:hypothetical protein